MAIKDSQKIEYALSIVYNMEVIIKTSAKAYTITVKDDKLYIDDEVYEPTQDEPKPTQDEPKPTHIHTLIDGIKTCRLESTGNFDSINDEPAYVDKHVQQWHRDCKLHRDNDQPAIVYNDGAQYWYKDGTCHRDNDQPAIVCANGDQYWYKDGKLHRDNDQPAIVYNDGTQHWYKDGKLHRDNGYPATILYEAGKLHKYQYWVGGKKMGETIF